MVRNEKVYQSLVILAISGFCGSAVYKWLVLLVSYLVEK